MVVKLRLSRWGASHNPFYSIVAANVRAARDKNHLEQLGTYNPIADLRGIKHIELNVARIKYWLGVGAQPTDRVNWLLSKVNLVPPLPKQQQAQGSHSLTDSKTWDIAVKDENGTLLTQLSAQEARDQFLGTDLERMLPKDEPRPLPKDQLKVKLTYDMISLDGTPPKEPLTESERLMVLKEYTGIH